MNEQEARRLLQLDEQADFAAARQQYRRLMMKYHPDAAGAENEAALEMAKKLNEAYRLLKLAALTSPEPGERKGRKTGAEKRSKTRTTILRQNRKAYCSRDLYVASPLHEDLPPMRVARGRFYWDPDVEDFRLFLRSVYRECNDLLEELERKHGYYSRSELPRPALHDRCIQKLLHLLAQEWIDPPAALVQLCREKQVGPPFHVEGTVAFSSANRTPSAEEMRIWRDIPEGAVLLPQLSDMRLLVWNETGYRFGHVFFDEDYWYYIVIPLLLQEAASVKITVKKKLAMSQLSAGKAMLALDLQLSHTEKKFHLQTERINEEISGLLHRYESKAL